MQKIIFFVGRNFLVRRTSKFEKKICQEVFLVGKKFIKKNLVKKIVLKKMGQNFFGRPKADCGVDGQKLFW